jgi:hypothetical protein
MAMDKSGNGTSTLSDSLRTVPQRVESFITPSSVEARGAAARLEIPALMKGKREAAAEQETLEFERDQGVIRKTADAERDVARGTRMAGKELETGLQKRGVFEAPQYKASDYAKNSATRMITAVLLGGIARTSAMGQLKAIESMQKAEQQGLADQFDAARLQFDEQEKQRQDNNKMLKDRFDRMIDLLGKDRNAALVEAKLIEGQLGKGIIATKLKAGLFYDAYDLAQKTFESDNRIALEKTKAKQVAGPDRRLKPGERWNEEKQVIEAIQGSDIFKKQKEKFSGEYKGATSVISQTENGLKKIDDILNEANTEGFKMNFGGYNAYATQYVSGPASDMRKKIDSFKNDMKAAGKQLLATGGSIGQITEREWPILQGMIASIDPVMSEKEAEEKFEEIRNQFRRLIERTIDTYETEFSDSQFYKPLPLGGVFGTPTPAGGSGQPAASANDGEFDDAKRRRLEELRRKRSQGNLGD